MKLGKSLPWLGVVASAAVLVNLNVLGARWYKRWDFTTDKLYTLSQPTRELLADLHEPVEVQVLLSKGDPLQVSVHHMLEAYGAVTRQLHVSYLDPDRNPAEFLAVQQKYQIVAGKAEDGRIITDAVIVMSEGTGAGSRHWFITADELVHLDEESGRSRPALEQALSGALANLRRLGDAKPKICFATGQREPTLDDKGPEGLSELGAHLAKNNYEAVSVDASSPLADYGSCAALVVATPEQPFSDDAAKRVTDYVKAGGSALLLLGPTLSESDRIAATGLEPVLELAGVSLGRDLVLEGDAALKLPRGQGELFFAKLLPHPITRGVLHEDEKLSSRVLVVQSRSLTVTGEATLVMQTSDSAFSVGSLSKLAEGQAQPSGERKSFGLAAARELAPSGAPPSGAKPSHGARLFVTGASNLAWNRNFQDPALYGNQRLIENAISWAAAKPSLISVPQKPERDVGISLSEESLAEVQRYVLLYMPAAAALLGGFVLLRRRNVERSSRQSGRRPEQPSRKQA